MSKTRKRNTEYYDEFDEYVLSNPKKEQNRRKSKRVNSALRSKDVDQLMRLTEED